MNRKFIKSIVLALTLLNGNVNYQPTANIKRTISDPSNDPTFDVSARGFDIGDNWIYSGKCNKDIIPLKGSKYDYGSMTSWSAAYYYNDERNNNLYVLLLATVTSMPNKNSYWDQKRWNTQDMACEFTSSYHDAEVLYSTPKPTNGTITTSSSFEVGASFDGEKLTLSIKFTNSESYTTSEIEITNDSSTANGATKYKNKINFHFKNYNKNTSVNNICCSDVKRQSYVIYKIEDYTPKKEYNFTVRNFVSIYRMGNFNHGTVTEHQDQTYAITC